MDTMTTIDRTSATAALVAACTAAALAPSVHNTQPWRWRIEGGRADLYADARRQLRVTDPDHRLLTVSCGAVLHEACVALAAAGITMEVSRLADPEDDDHSRMQPARIGLGYLARITVTGRAPISDTAARLHRMTTLRHADRRPLLDEPLPATAMTAMRAVAGTFGIALHPLSRDQVITLASATSRSQDAEVREPAARAELDAWTDPQRPADAGVPDTSIPDRIVPTTVPMRDFGHLGSLAIPDGHGGRDGHDNSATYVILYGLAEQARSWLRAGEALDAIWLTATEHDIALLPLSAAVESTATRQELHRILAGLGYPYLALRLGIADASLPAADRTPRLPADVNVEVLP
ncbi:MAG TPA: nitroreductase [Micromonosporaceae bacterium]